MKKTKTTKGKDSKKTKLGTDAVRTVAGKDLKDVAGGTSFTQKWYNGGG